MIRPAVVKVTPLDNYLLSVVLDNNATKIINTKPYIKGEWYSKLKDPDYFKTVRVNGYTLEGHDIS